MAALEMRASSKWWYGRFQHDGKTHCKNLGIQIEGSRPKSLRLEGDATFEQSRGQARMAMEELIRQVKAPQSRSTLTKAVYQATAAYEAQTGSTVKQVAISELPDYWASIPRKRPPAPRYASQCKSVLNEFVRFVAENAPGTTKAHLVTRELALNYLKAQQERGMTAKTWNDRLKLLRSTFKHLPDLPDNPFANIPEREVETVFREPYSPEEIEDILAASTQEKVVRPVIITALCTAMRLGDCATLEWSSVDLEDGFITVKTSKTRATVDIPLFPMLFDEIQSRVGNGAQYVFPEAAEIYLHNSAGLTCRLRKVLRLAGFGDPEKGVLVTFSKAHNQEVIAKAHSTLDDLGESKKTSRMRAVFDAYLSGESAGDVASRIGIGKGSVSQYLNEIETLIEMPFIRGKQRKPASRGPVRRERADGLRKASLRDFHSFRTTWITLALISGIPIDIIKRVTGHKTVEVVVKHYFRPQREELRKVLRASMPKLLTSGMQLSTTDQVNELLRQALQVRGKKGWALVEEASKIIAGPLASISPG